MSNSDFPGPKLTVSFTLDTEMKESRWPGSDELTTDLWFIIQCGKDEQFSAPSTLSHYGEREGDEWEKVKATWQAQYDYLARYLSSALFSAAEYLITESEYADCDLARLESFLPQLESEDINAIAYFDSDLAANAAQFILHMRARLRGEAPQKPLRRARGNLYSSQTALDICERAITKMVENGEQFSENNIAKNALRSKSKRVARATVQGWLDDSQLKEHLFRLFQSLSDS